MTVFELMAFKRKSLIDDQQSILRRIRDNRIIHEGNTSTIYDYDYCFTLVGEEHEILTLKTTGTSDMWLEHHGKVREQPEKKRVLSGTLEECGIFIQKNLEHIRGIFDLKRVYDKSYVEEYFDRHIYLRFHRIYLRLTKTCNKELLNFTRAELRSRLEILQSLNILHMELDNMEELLNGPITVNLMSQIDIKHQVLTSHFKDVTINPTNLTKRMVNIVDVICSTINDIIDDVMLGADSYGTFQIIQLYASISGPILDMTSRIGTGKDLLIRVRECSDKLLALQQPVRSVLFWDIESFSNSDL